AAALVGSTLQSLRRPRHLVCNRTHPKQAVKDNSPIRPKRVFDIVSKAGVGTFGTKFLYLLQQRSTFHPQDMGGLALVALGCIEHFADHFTLELIDEVFEVSGRRDSRRAELRTAG